MARPLILPQTIHLDFGPRTFGHLYFSRHHSAVPANDGVVLAGAFYSMTFLGQVMRLLDDPEGARWCVTEPAPGQRTVTCGRVSIRGALNPLVYLDDAALLAPVQHAGTLLEAIMTAPLRPCQLGCVILRWKPASQPEQAHRVAGLNDGTVHVPLARVNRSLKAAACTARRRRRGRASRAAAALSKKTPLTLRL